MKKITLIAVLALGVQAGWATEIYADKRVDNSAASGTAQWLKIQREGSQQSKRVQAQTPAEQERSFQRLLDSYEHKIPEYYEGGEGGTVKRN